VNVGEMCPFLFLKDQIKDIIIMCVFITEGPSTKLFARGGGDMGGHVLRETKEGGHLVLSCVCVDYCRT
jgi:hypothetical protein